MFKNIAKFLSSKYFEGKAESKHLALFVLLLFIFSGPLFAQSPANSNPELESNVLRVYFFLLVFAIIISRVVEYIKLIFQWLWPKLSFLQKVGDLIWKTVKKNLDRLPLEYDEQKIHEQVNKITVALTLQLLSFILGAIFCLAFKIDVVSALNFHLSNAALRYTLSGLLAGAGISPVHSVFRMADEKRRIRKLKSMASGSSNK